MKDWVLQEAVEQLAWKVRYLVREVEKLKAAQGETAELVLQGEERIKHVLRGQAAAGILEASETDVDAEVLAKMLAADGSIPAGEILAWLRMVLHRGEGNVNHPLFPYLVDKKPLRFGKKTVASPAAPVQ